MKNKRLILFSISILPNCLVLLPSFSSAASNEENLIETKATLHKENIGNSEFNLTLKSNNIPCDYTGTYLHESTLIPINKMIGINYVNTTVEDFYLSKRGENYYRVYLNSSKAKEGDVFTLFGEYSNPTGIKVKILTSQFKYDGSSFLAYEPEIKIESNEYVKAENNVIYVNNGASKNEIVASISNDFNGEISYEFPQNSLTNDKLVSFNGKKEYDDFYIYCKSNGYTFRYDYKLVVGYKDFTLEKGASLNLNQPGSIEARCQIPSFVLNESSEIGFLAVKKNDLGNLSFDENSLFVENKDFSFNKVEEGKVLVNKRYAFATSNFDETYTLLGRIDNVKEADYLSTFLFAFYLKNEYGYFLANNYDLKCENSTRSVYGIASRGVDENDENKELLKTTYLAKENEVNYSIRYLDKQSNAVLMEEKKVGKLNEAITINFKEIKIGGFSYKIFGNNEIKGKLLDNDLTFDVYLVNADAGINIYAYDCPYLSCLNNYDNDFNRKICSDLVKYGFNGVIYSGQTIGTCDNVEALIDITTMFYKNGLKTIINDRSYSTNNLHFYDGVPDFSNVAGFAGFLSWDEPKNEDGFNSIKEMASSFNSIYQNKSDAKFITTLLPSYGVDSFKDYVDEYVSLINPSLTDSSLKSLCTDFYPFTYNGSYTSLSDYYVHDLLYLRSKSSENNATPFLIMQLSSVDNFSRASYYSEMLLQSYMALSFGFRNIVWYKVFSSDETSLFVKESKTDSSYNQIYKVTTSTSLDVLHVNKEILKIASLIKDYEYEGTYLSSVLGNYSLHLHSSSMGDRLSSLPSQLKISSSSKYHVGVYKNKDKYAYIISSYLNNDETYSLKINASSSFMSYCGENEKNILASTQYSFDSLKQGESIVLL